MHVYQTEPLADVIADDYQVRLEQSPALGAGCVVEFETIFSLAGAYLEYEGLIYIPEKGDGGLTGEVLAALADSPVCGLAYSFGSMDSIREWHILQSSVIDRWFKSERE